jgi:hypothetical protein
MQQRYLTLQGPKNGKDREVNGEMLASGEVVFWRTSLRIGDYPGTIHCHPQVTGQKTSYVIGLGRLSPARC